MDDDKKLFEELLKADSIDPAGVSEAERAVFRDMLDSEQKRMKRLCRRTNTTLWIFVLVMLGLCLSENILEALHIPFSVCCFVLGIAMFYVMIRYMPGHNRMMKESGRKIGKLYYLVHGRHRGIILVGKKDGKRHIYWPRIIMIAAAIWLAMSLGGAGVFYLLCGRWIYSSEPILHIIYCTLPCLSLVIFVLRDGLKTPLEDLTEVKTKSKQSKPGLQSGVWRIIMKSKMTKFAAAAVIITATIIGINQFGGSIDGASVALADVAEKIEQIKNCVFKKTTTVSPEGNSTFSFDSLVYYTEAAIREDVYDNEKIVSQVYVDFLEVFVVGVDHKGKVYRELALADEDIEKLSPISPKNIVNLILSKGKYKKLGPKTVDGVLSEGFEFNDKRAMLSMDKERSENVVTRLWVDVKTNLPVRIEVEGVLNNNSKASAVMYDPEWDIELESDFFEPKIPVDYMRPEQRGFLGINLEKWPTLKIIPGMAAEKAGIKDGDIALKVNGNSIVNIKSSADALNLLLGKAGEKVVLTVKRGEQIVTFEIEREPSPAGSVK